MGPVVEGPPAEGAVGLGREGLGWVREEDAVVVEGAGGLIWGRMKAKLEVSAPAHVRGEKTRLFGGLTLPHIPPFPS